MSKRIFFPRFCFLTNIMSCGIFHAFTDCHNNIILFLKCFVNVFDEFFFIKYFLAQINELWNSSFFCSCKCRRCRQPSGISPHDFYDRYRWYIVYKAVTCNFCKCCCNKFSSRTESRTMICLSKVIINRLWCSHNFNIIYVIFFAING